MWQRTTMRLGYLAALMLAAKLPWSPVEACGGYPDPDDLAKQAVSDQPEVSRRAISMLRMLGPRGLEALVAANRAAIERYRSRPDTIEPGWPRISAALDAVAAQKDAWASELYWYTDLERAKSAAKHANKPILSLRLLGTLDAEFSCANSRFFRTVLYPNAAVRKQLREDFVLHWQSHRPVPRLTIDFGDGRKIERTITGNSAHYVLTPDGRVVDAIPGLYGPAAFLRELEGARGLAQRHAAGDFDAVLAWHHRRRLEAVQAAWGEDLRRVNPAAAAAGAPGSPRDTSAAAATRIAVGKSLVELRPVQEVAAARPALAASTDDRTWAAIAELHEPEARLDAGSRAVIASKGGPARVLRAFERAVAEDTVRNQYLLHSQVHEWFAGGTAPASLEELNERVYAELFLMPRSDPWLGLVPPDAYTALPREATVGVE